MPTGKKEDAEQDKRHGDRIAPERIKQRLCQAPASSGVFGIRARQTPDLKFSIGNPHISQRRFVGYPNHLVQPLFGDTVGQALCLQEPGKPGKIDFRGNFECVDQGIANRCKIGLYPRLSSHDYARDEDRMPMIENEDQQVLSQLTRWLEEGRKAWLATVVKTWGSSPRPVGSLLCCNEDGQTAGSLSGGCIEEDLLEKITESRTRDREAGSHAVRQNHRRE